MEAETQRRLSKGKPTKGGLFLVLAVALVVVTFYIWGSREPVKTQATSSVVATIALPAQNQNDDASRPSQNGGIQTQAASPAAIKQFQDSFDAYNHTMQALKGAEEKLHREHPLVEVAVEWGRASTVATQQKYKELFDDFYAYSTNPAHKDQVEALFHQSEALLSSVILFESLEAKDPIGDSTLGAITKNLLDETDTLEIYKDDFVKAIQSAGVDPSEIDNVRGAKTPVEVIAFVQRYATQLRVKYNSQAVLAIPDPRFRTYIDDLFQASIHERVTWLYQASWDREIRALRSKSEIQGSEWREFMQKFPIDSPERTVMGNIASDYFSKAFSQQNK